MLAAVFSHRFRSVLFGCFSGFWACYLARLAACFISFVNEASLSKKSVCSLDGITTLISLCLRR
jgi:hypothetical protein